jgi:histidine triad (HIT) family protein
MKAKIRFSDDRCVAFDDVNPAAPVHILVIPKKHITNISGITPEDHTLIGHMFAVANQVAKDAGLSESGYRLVFNNGPDAGQSVHHLHLHILGGRALKWPPG